MIQANEEVFFKLRYQYAEAKILCITNVIILV